MEVMQIILSKRGARPGSLKCMNLPRKLVSIKSRLGASTGDGRFGDWIDHLFRVAERVILQAIY
jgi:hypothetical protein